MKSKEWRVKSEELSVKSTNPGFDVGAASSCPHFEEIAKEKKNIRINSEKYKFREFDAITLISLVITIIILIILASVAINLTIGENGIFTKAKEGSEKYEIAQIRETVELGILDVEMSELNRGNEVTIELVLQELLDNKIFESIDKETKIGNIGEYEVKLKYNENGKVVIEYIQKATGIRITYTLEPSTYTNKEEVNILFKVQGKIKNIIKPDGEKYISTKETEELNYKVTSNGTYKFTAENEEGKIQEKEVIVDIIDTLPPKEFEITAETTRTGEIIIQANTEDEEANETSAKSGIGRYEYYIKLKTESEYTKYDTNEIANMSSGTYEIYAVAYDKAGNPSTPSEKIEVEIEEWIEIWNEEDLRNISNGLSKNYILMTNIELKSEWTAIENNFTGKLDGNYYKITNLNVNASEANFQGLFGAIGLDGKVSNLNVEGSVIGNEYTGILVGHNRGTIENVKVSGTVTSSNYFTGGLAGLNNGTIIETYSSVTVTSDCGYVGGLVGKNIGRIEKSASSGNVIENTASSASAYEGGLVGENTGTITYAYSTGKVIGYINVGGLVGLNTSGTIIDAYSTGEVTGIRTVGGLVGDNNGGTITNTYTISKVTGASSIDIGGLVGKNSAGTAENSYWTPEKAGIETSIIGIKINNVSDMLLEKTYQGFEFEETWIMKEYPELRGLNGN